jgi:hypothetical protein
MMRAKTICKILSILLFFTFSKIAIGQIIEIPLDDLNFNLEETKKIYIKKVTYFEYKSDEFITDSINVKENNLKFDLSGKEGLFLISDNQLPPITYLPLIQSPEIYYFMFCSNFYKSENYIYLSKNYSKEEFEFFRWFYKNFTTKSFDKKLFSKGEYKKINKERVKKLVEKRKIWFRNKLNKKSNTFSDKFVNYINTEIELGAINQYLNWYEVIYEKQIKNGICSGKQIEEHDYIYKKYLSENWDINSIQYFRLVERTVNYSLSKENCEFKMYHETSDDKTRIAKQILDKESFKRYKKNRK